MNFNQLRTRQIRAEIVQLLENSDGYVESEGLLQAALGLRGLQVSIDKVKTELRWLEEQGLLTVDLADSDIALVARITSRGVDVALGRARIDGVARPRP